MTSLTIQSQTHAHPKTALPSPIQQKLQRDLHTLDMQQRGLLAGLRSVNRRNQRTEEALERHVRRLEWMLCLAFAMLCVLMIAVGMLWRQLP